MYFQSEYLREAATMTRNQTYRIDLPETGLLSTLVMEVSADAVSGLGLGGGPWRLLDYLGLVEVIGNGAEVIKSLTAKQLFYLNFLHNKIPPPHFWRNYATNTQFDYIVVCFGRYLNDPDYGLDLSKWDNVELRVTNSATSSTHGNDLSVDVKQHFMRDPGASMFKGHLRSEIWRQWTTVQDETKYNTLPTRWPIATVALECVPGVDGNFLANTSFTNLADSVQLTLKGGTLKVFNGGIDHLVVENYLEDGQYVRTGGHIDVTADKGVSFSVGRSWARQVGSSSLDGAGSATIPTITGDNTDFTIHPETREADSPIEIAVDGMGLCETVHLWHNHWLDPVRMLDPVAMGPVDLNVHTKNASSAASGTNSILLERLVV